MPIGNIEIVPVSEFDPKGRKLKCVDCLYGNPKNCNFGLFKRCAKYLGWFKKTELITYHSRLMVSDIKKSFDKTSFFEIVDNPNYFEEDEDDRYYMFCDTCGYILYDKMNKCQEKGHFVQILDFNSNKINEIKENKIVNDLYCIDDDY